ncbi:fatty acid desaturase family protein [Bacteroidota bacterium]
MEQQTIEFPAQHMPEFMKELRKEVAGYFEENSISKYGNLNLVFKSIFMLSLYLAPYILMLSGVISTLSGVFICWIIIGIGKAGVGMGIMHDANHRSYSKSQTTNRWLGNTLFLLGGFPANWQYQHNTMHHGYTNIDGYDEDIDPGPILRFSPHQPLLKIHKFQHLYAWFLYGLMTFSWVTTKDFSQLNGYRKSGVPLGSNRSYTQMFVVLIISKIIYYSAFLLIPMLVLPFAWFWIIIFFLTMHFTSGFILTVIFQTAHVVGNSDYPLPDENGKMANNWAVHQLHTTSDFAHNNKVLSWLIGGLNFQIEHHLFPNISHVHYPKISNLVKKMADKYNLPYHVQRGFIRAVWEHGRMLKKLGRPN